MNYKTLTGIYILSMTGYYINDYLEHIKNATYKTSLLNEYFNKPCVNSNYKCISHKAFSQKLLNNAYPFKFIDPKQAGNCYGLTIIWYLKFISGENAIDDLNKIISTIENKKPLDDKQLNMIENINFIQNHQCLYYLTASNTNIKFKINTHSTNLNVNVLKNKSNDNAIPLKNAVDYVIKRAIDKPNKLIQAYPIDNHILGVVAVKSDDKIWITIFDSNFGELTIESKDAGEKLLLYYKYYINFSEQNTVTSFVSEAGLYKKHGVFWKAYKEENSTDKNIIQHVRKLKEG